MTSSATRRRIEGPRSVGKSVTDRIADGEDDLTEASTMGLLTAAYQLTHAMHAISKGDEDQSPRLRAQRDLITAEVLRRTGGQ